MNPSLAAPPPADRWLFRADVGRLSVHGVLLGYTAAGAVPRSVLVLINAVKSRAAIFDDPLALPAPWTAGLAGRLPQGAGQPPTSLQYFGNSLVVTLGSLVLIVLFGAMAAWALTEYRVPRAPRCWPLFLAFGIMIPIRLGTVSILELAVRLELVNTLSACWCWCTPRRGCRWRS